MSLFNSKDKAPVFVLVDDSIEDLRLNEYALMEVFSDAQIHTFESGEDFTMFWEKQEFTHSLISAIFIDYHMPRSMSAVEVLSFLGPTTLKNIPLYIFSGCVLPDLRNAMIQKGATDFLEKPGNLFDHIKLFREVLTPSLVYSE